MDATKHRKKRYRLKRLKECISSSTDFESSDHSDSCELMDCDEHTSTSLDRVMVAKIPADEPHSIDDTTDSEINSGYSSENPSIHDCNEIQPENLGKNQDITTGVASKLANLVLKYDLSRDYATWLLAAGTTSEKRAKVSSPRTTTTFISVDPTDFQVLSNKLSFCKGPDYTSLYFVALHELGHAMGLQHSEIKDAVMNAPYTGSRAYATNNLDYDDISALRNHYFDEMRKSPLGVNQKMDGVILEDVDYHPRLPLPSRCHKNINAAFYLHNRPDITESIFLMTNGYLFRFKASNWFQKRSPMKGYPKRTSEYFPDAEGVIDAAFDTGSRVYFIIGSRVLVYSVEFKFETEIIQLEEDGTLESIFGAKVSNSNKITAAFNHVKKIGCSKGKEVCVETTLVVSPSEFFVLKWSKFGKKLNSVQQITSPTQMLGYEVPETQFQAAFEWFREGQLEVMQFDTSKSARTRVPFPQNAQTRTSSNDVPTTFGIAGWCIT